MPGGPHPPCADSVFFRKMRVREALKGPWLPAALILTSVLSIAGLARVETSCVPQNGCQVALAYYRAQFNDTLNIISGNFQTSLANIRSYNPSITNMDYITDKEPIFIPFTCQCVDNQLGHQFLYKVQNGDTVSQIAATAYENLTTSGWIATASSLTSVDDILIGSTLNVPVNCSCGDSHVSSQYGLFATYIVQPGDDVSSIASQLGTDEALVREYNADVNWNNLRAQQIIFAPVKDATGNYPSFLGSTGTSRGLSAGAIAGAAVGGALVVFAIIALALFCLCVYIPKKESKLKKQQEELDGGINNFGPDIRRQPSSGTSLRATSRTANTTVVPTMLSDFTVDKSVEFTYEELVKATNEFSVSNKIGQGGYGAVYYGVINGQKLAIKRMNLQATKEFMAELQVLTHVHHTNLVQLIGYCTVESLFLVYEFVENGTLDQHLHKGTASLPWIARVQIALDAARGLEYIHEHTKPTYIHRDIKSANILIDKQLHAKVADFGLTKLTESGIGSHSTTMPTRVVGTWGYMSPEYARFGDVSPKVDVYSFGVVLFEIISGRQAIVRVSTGSSGSSSIPHREEQRALVSLFEAELKDPNGKEKLYTLVDPSLGDNYPLDSAWKMAQLAAACTQENPELRPSMRTAVVALMTLSSSTQEWEISAFAGDTAMGSGVIAGR